MANSVRGKRRSKRAAHGKKRGADSPDPGGRYTPLLSREQFTFSRMRMERGGPRIFSAICFRGWVQA